MAEVTVLCGEPLSGSAPADIRQWIQKNDRTDAAIAEAMAAVGQKVGWLHHELNDPDNDEAAIKKYEKEYHGWWELEKELVAEIIVRLKEHNRVAGTNYATEGKGWHYIIEPFMEKNGFRDSAGWWIRK